MEQLKLLDKVDCAGMIKKANNEIKVLNQILDRLVPFDDSHTVITEGRKLDIEVIPGNLLTYKVPVKGPVSPIKFIITYNNNSTSEDPQANDTLKKNRTGNDFFSSKGAKSTSK